MKVLVKAAIILSILSTVISGNDEFSLNAGPVTNIMENLADNTAYIVDEIHSGLELKIARSADVLSGNIQVITINAMEQMAEAFYMANQKLPNCPQHWTMQELEKRIDDQLSNCTVNLYDLRTVFTGENSVILQGIQTYVTELANIPAYCEVLNSADGTSGSFASSTACFVQKLAELNQNVGQLISQANTSLIRTRKLARTGVVSSTECTLKVIEYFTNYLNEAFKNC